MKPWRRGPIGMSSGEEEGRPTGNELRDEADHKMTWPLSGAVGDSRGTLRDAGEALMTGLHPCA
jgi:hypothetical protein